MSRAGAVDGITHLCNTEKPTVDGISLEENIDSTSRCLIKIDQANDSLDVYMKRYIPQQNKFRPYPYKPKQP
jgi:hypothetical protein